jgi:hypothetical protein
MRCVLNSISLLILTMLLGVGFMVLGTGQAEAGLAPCTVGIEKVAIPDNNTPFDFTVSGDQTAEFTLQDPSNPISTGGMSIGQTVTITEEVPPGWVLVGIECTEGVTDCGPPGEFIPCLTATVSGNSVTFFCEDNDTAFCVFTNAITASSIPTLSEWGLIAMAAVIGAAGIFMALRKRRAAA